MSIGRDCFTNAHRSFEIWTEYGATAVQYAIDNSHAYYYLSLTDWHVPGGTLYLGYDFNMYGYVRSTVKVTSVTAAIANASGEVVREASATPNVTNYSIGGDFAEQLSIETLPLGNYTFTLGAVTSKSSETFVSRGFKVQEAPLIVNLSRYSLRSTSMDKGDDRPVTGLLSANYPITRVTLRVAPDEGNAIDNSAAPGTDSYQLSGLGVNLSALEAGDYTVSILVQGHGETVETGKVSIGVNGLTLASGSQIDEGAFDAFIRDRANKEYWLNSFPGIRTYETQAMNVLGYDVYVANGIIFSNAEDYANACFRD